MAALTRKASERLGTGPTSIESGLNALRSRKSRQSAIFWVSSTFAFGLLTTGNPLVFIPLLGIFKSAKIITRYARIYDIIERLYDEFNNSDIEILHDLDMREDDERRKEYTYLDLYVRLPKTQLFIAIRAMGKRVIVFKENKETLCIRRTKGRVNEVQPCPLLGLNDAKRWLMRNRKLFGLSSNQVMKVPSAKVLVLWGDTMLEQHRDELYSSIGNGKYLNVSKKGTKTFVVHQEDIARFARDWLTHIGK